MDDSARSEFLKLIADTLSDNEIKLIEKYKTKKRKLLRYRNTWKTIRAEVDGDVITKFYTETRRLIKVGHDDVFIDYKPVKQKWVAAAGVTHFQPKDTLSELVDTVRYHKRHIDIDRIFISELSKFEEIGNHQILKDRYKKVYIVVDAHLLFFR